MLRAFRQRRERRRIANALCARLSVQARDPAFYAACRVDDSFDGRFDLLVLHAWLVLEALQYQGAGELAQDLVDVVFVQLDEALREQGAGDMSMKRRMKKMGSAFYGRVGAYSDATDESRLAAALLRNVYREQPERIEQAARLAKYACAAREGLAHSRLTEGEAHFGPVPLATETNNDDDHSPRAIS